jgi:hypothetical protein
MGILKDGSLLSMVDDIKCEITHDVTFYTDGFEIRH